MAASGRRVAFVPPRDVVDEFKVETANFDAADGHTAGGNVNVALKSGTNDLHGTLYEFLRNDKLSGNDFFLNRSGRPREGVERAQDLDVVPHRKRLGMGEVNERGGDGDHAHRKETLEDDTPSNGEIGIQLVADERGRQPVVLEAAARRRRGRPD